VTPLSVINHQLIVPIAYIDTGDAFYCGA